ncbi:MAG: hypothetical protein JO034_17785 [Singulisphaera sp.]|nr:hypothetical protein [Singulisphaera sp.]
MNRTGRPGVDRPSRPTTVRRVARTRLPVRVAERREAQTSPRPSTDDRITPGLAQLRRPDRQAVRAIRRR